MSTEYSGIRPTRSQEPAPTTENAQNREPETILTPLKGFSLEDLQKQLAEKRAELLAASEKLHNVIQRIVHHTPLPDIVKERMLAFEKDYDMSHFYERGEGTSMISTYFDRLDPTTGLTAYRKLHDLAYRVANLAKAEIPRYEMVIRSKTPPPLSKRHALVRQTSIQDTNPFPDRRVG